MPLRDASNAEPEEECVPGIRTDTNEYYAINFYLMSQTHEEIEIGEYISASGVITPVERLSTDMWRKYVVGAIFSVTDSLEILE